MVELGALDRRTISTIACRRRLWLRL